MLRRLFEGRYGYDWLSVFIGSLALIADIVAAIFGVAVLSFVALVLMALVLVRAFSRNIVARRRENAVFMRLFNRVRFPVKRLFLRIRYIKTLRFRKCPHCKAVLRLPRKKGKHNVNCPKCHASFEVRIRL